MGKVLDGKRVAAALRSNLSVQVAAYATRFGRSPRLDVVIVGEDPASHIYVRHKTIACEEVGIRSVVHRFSANATRREIVRHIVTLNEDADVDGILVQRPLPEASFTHDVTSAIRSEKDVDGLHPWNAGALSQGHGTLIPCTPSGCLHLLNHARVPLEGAHVVIIGRSDIVGKPMALLALQGHATVTVAHSRTKHLDALCREADILVAATGMPHLVRGNWVKPGATVLDVGITRGADDKLVGDVAFSEVIAHAAWVTPVPGGVGPMTIACLLENTLQVAKARAL